MVTTGQDASPGGNAGSRSAEAPNPKGRRNPLAIRSVIGPFLRGQRRRLVTLALSSAVGGLAEAAVLVFIARAAFALASDRDTASIGVGPASFEMALGFALGLAAILVIVRTALQAVQAALAARIQTGVLTDIRTSIVASYLDATWELQSAEREGRLQELLTTYAISAAQAVLSFSQGLVAGFSLAALMVAAFVVNAAAAIVVAAAATLIGLLLRPIRGAVQRRSRRTGQANLAFATALTEFAATTQEVRVLGAEGRVKEKLGALSDEAALHLRRTRFIGGVIPGVYQGAGLLLVVGVLGLTSASGVTDLGSLGAVVLIMIRALSYGQAVQTSLQTLHEAVPYFETLHDEELRYSGSAISALGGSVGAIGDLRFERVGFEYTVGEPVLHDLSFRVPHGEIVGIVGPSGAGKSTLVQLILRLRDPTRGHMLVDDREVQGLALRDWYRHVTFVPQDAHLFAGTVADNISFFRDATIDQIIRAAKRAQLHDEIMAWPRGYDTAVGERGSELSGGQRQRLCIARALLEDPDLIVLDEPTSSLDSRSEALMRETMRDLAPRATVFVVAHRLSTLSVCDRIMVIQEGRLENFDAPDKLEEGDPFYREALRLSGMR